MRWCLCIILLLTFTSTAQAQENPLTNVEFNTDGLFYGATEVADIYWGQKCPGSMSYLYTERETGTNIAARANLNGCDIYWERSFVERVRSSLTEDILTQEYTYGLTCAVAVHERGHNYGHDHSDHGIMRPVITNIPTICRQWAKAIIRRVHGSRVHRRSSGFAWGGTVRRSKAGAARIVRLHPAEEVSVGTSVPNR